METLKIITLATGLDLECGEKKLHLHYAELQLPYDEAKEFCKEQGGELPTIDQLLFLSDHLDEINNALEKDGKEVLGGGIRSNQESGSKDANGRRPSALVVDIYRGYVLDYGKYFDSYVRPVSAFQS